MAKFLILDKRKRIGDLNTLPYVIERLQEELNERQIEYEFGYFDEVSIDNIDKFDVKFKNESITKFSHILLRGHRTRSEYQLKRIINDFATSKGIKVQNSEFMKFMEYYDKIVQIKVCEENDINYPKSIYKFDGRYDMLQNIKFPVIYKHSEGVNEIEKTGSEDKLKKQIYMLNNLEELRKQIDVKDNPADFFIQEFLPVGVDFRIIISNSKYLAGFKRTATESFMTVRGGAYSLASKKELEILIPFGQKTAKAFKAQFCALDIMLFDNKPYLLEINMNPGFKAIETKVEGLKVNIAAEIIEGMLN